MSRLKKIAIGFSMLSIIAMAIGWFRFVSPLRHSVSVGEAMLAKQVCSCVYLAKRAEPDCRADLMASMDRIELEVIRDESRTRAWITGFGERSAVYREGLGCTLE